MKIVWEDNFKIKSTVNENSIIISANKEGLLSLARHLTALAKSASGDHIHYDEYNSLEEGSTEVVIEKVQ